MAKIRPVDDTTERTNDAGFEDWTFETGLPDGDALQRMCANAAALAVKELVGDMWLSVSYSKDRGSERPDNPLEFSVHAWDGAVNLGRPFAEVMQELADLHSYVDGTMDEADPDVLTIIGELEAAVAMMRARMRPRPGPGANAG